MPITLEQIDERLKRWRPRLTRASNEVTKLLKMRDRALKTKKPVETDHLNEEQFNTFVENGMAAQKAVDDLLTIPAELRRETAIAMQEKADEQLVDKLKERRAEKTEADKHKMPLTGKAAMDHIKRRKGK